MRLAPIAAFLCLLLCFGALPASADAVDAAVAGARGGALGIQSDAESTASSSAARQAANQSLSHASIAHLTSVCSRAAEIVGAGPSIDLIFAGFKGSPNHWSKLTDPGWTSMGTGVAQGADGKLYVSVVFCVGDSSPTPIPAPPPDPEPEPSPKTTVPATDMASTTPTTAAAPEQPDTPDVAVPKVEVDLVGLITAILSNSLDSLTADEGHDNPVTSLLDRFIDLPSGVTIV